MKNIKRKIVNFAFCTLSSLFSRIMWNEYLFHMKNQCHVNIFSVALFFTFSLSLSISLLQNVPFSRIFIPHENLFELVVHFQLVNADSIMHQL